MNGLQREWDHQTLPSLPVVEWVDDNEWNAIEGAFNAIAAHQQKPQQQQQQQRRLHRPHASSPSRPIRPHRIAASMVVSSILPPAPAAAAAAAFASAHQLFVGPASPKRRRASVAPRKLSDRLTQSDCCRSRVSEVWRSWEIPSRFPSRIVSGGGGFPVQSSNRFPQTPPSSDLEAGEDADCIGALLPVLHDAAGFSGSELGGRVTGAAELGRPSDGEEQGIRGAGKEKSSVRKLPAWMQNDPQSVGTPCDDYASEEKDCAANPQGIPAADSLREESMVAQVLQRSAGSNAELGNVVSSVEQTFDRPYALVKWEKQIPWGLQPSLLYEIKPQIPAMQFRGQIVYSKTESEVNAATLELWQRVRQLQATTQGAVPIGFDLEWKASFQKGDVPRKAAVLQLCLDGYRCDVMQIIYSGIPSSLQSLLEESSTLKVGVGANGDAAKLRRDYQIAICKVVDLHFLAKKKINPVKQWSLSSLAQELTGKQVDKNPSIRCGDWEACPLSQPQLQYAATDAFASWHLYQVLASFPNVAVGDTESCGHSNRSEPGPPVM